MKIKYFLLNKHTNQLHVKIYELELIERGGLKDLFDVDNYEIVARLRFAGLPDKKGVDAYENDLAKHPSSKHLFEIVFYKGTFWLQSQEPSLLKNNIKTNISHLEFCEIIGNSFTNQELINK